MMWQEKGWDILREFLDIFLKNHSKSAQYFWCSPRLASLVRYGPCMTGRSCVLGLRWTW